MVERGIGRTEAAEVRRLRMKARRRTEAQHSDVREPAPPLRLVDAELARRADTSCANLSACPSRVGEASMPTLRVSR